MRRLGTSVVPAIAVMAFFASAASTSFAQSADPQARQPAAAEVSIARDQFKAGMDAAKQNRWDEARKAFQHSYDLYPRPLTLLNLAGAQAQSGQLVVAAENYRRFIRESAGTPAAEQRASAQQSLAQLEARTSHVRLKVDNLQPSDRLDLDGQRLNAASVGLMVPIDPGEHKLVVTRDGNEVAKTIFSIEEKETRDIVLVAPLARPGAADASGGGPPIAAGFAASGPEHGSELLQPVPPPRNDKAEPRKGGVLRSPWLWAAAAVVVIGGAVAVGVAASHSSSTGAGPSPFAGNLSSSQVLVR